MHRRLFLWSQFRLFVQHRPGSPFIHLVLLLGSDRSMRIIDAVRFRPNANKTAIKRMQLIPLAHCEIPVALNSSGFESLNRTNHERVISSTN